MTKASGTGRGGGAGRASKTGGKGTRAAAAAKPAPRVRRARSGAALVTASVEELMIHAYAMENEAAERYAEFADAMEVHNNLEVAELFRKMARIENLHAQQIRERMGWHTVPAPASGAYRWDGLEGPETADHGELHYLMTPHHALQIARVNEERARRFYEGLASVATDDEVRSAAEEMRDEEADHVRLIDEWIARTPAPERDWSADLDPPNYNE